MKEDLLMEYIKFKHVASILQANASEHDAKTINFRLAILHDRFEEYSKLGLDIEEARRREQERHGLIGTINRNI